MGRIKSTLSTKLGRRKSLVASPTQEDLAKTEPEAAGNPSDRQQDEDDDNGEEVAANGTKTEDPFSDDQKDSTRLLHFDAPLLIARSTDDETNRDAKQDEAEDEEMSERSRDTYGDCDDDGSEHDADDKGESDEVEVFAAHDGPDEPILGRNSDEEEEAGEQMEQIAGASHNGDAADDDDDDDDDTLEVFEHREGGQQRRQSSCREPEDDEEEDERQDYEADAGCPFDPSPPLESVELVVIGVSPMTLRHRTAVAPPTSPQRRMAPQASSVDDLESVTMPAVSQALVSPVKCSRPGVDIGRAPASSPRAPYSRSIRPSHTVDPHAHAHLQGIREEDSGCAIEVEQHAKSPLRHFAGRRQAITASMAEDTPILASASAGICIQDEEHGSEEAFEREGGHEELSTTQSDVDASDTEAFDAGAIITQVFGERVVALLGADPWGDRQDGFDAIQLAVKKADVSTSDSLTRQRVLCASFAAVQCGVEDRVAPVMFCALECLRTVLKEFARVLPAELAFSNAGAKSVAALNAQLSALIAALVQKLGDSNKRTQREATQALVRVARVRSLRALPHLLLHLSGREVPVRRQLETLRRLVQELGLANSVDPSSEQHLSPEIVLQFVAPSLKIAEEKTRRAAVELLADLQTRSDNAAAWHTQLARAGAVKPEMLRVLTRRVDELLAKREQQQQQATADSAAMATGGSATNQAEEQADDEAAFPPAELVGVPQEDAHTSVALLETALGAAHSVVGPVCWRKLSSKTWSDRKEALLEVEKAMGEARSDLRDTRPAFGSSAQSTFVAYCALLHRALGDSIAPVVNGALDAFVTLVKIFGPRIEWREADVRDVTLLTLLRLLSVMQRPNTRTTRAACRGVLKLARLPNARHPLRYVLSCVFANEGGNVCDPQVQMHLLRLLVPEFGFQADGLGASRVLDAVSKGLAHNSARVRRSAADVALSTQRLLGRDFVLARLQGVKSATLKELEKSFVDGVGGSGGGERPQTVHATAAEASAPAAIGDSELPPVTFGGLGEFSSRRMLSSAPVGIGRLQCTPLYEETSTGVSASRRASVLSNEEENLMDAILGTEDDL
ncbi:hypothetical protein BBJ28_00009273 [Nothophytophthora sp. Chile5]|nr:hypothetical protein BBJ28_00009273 [Nothophytophthora sp. Chile5]